MSTEGPLPSLLGMDSRGSSKSNSTPKDAVKEARAKLRHLQHKKGLLREYVREFQELLLEIPNMGEEDALFAFLDGLSG